MSMSNDLKRAENLADLFAAPSKPAPVLAPEAPPAAKENARRSLAVVEDTPAAAPPDTAVAEAVGVMETVITIPVDELADDLDHAEGELEADAAAALSAERSARTTVAPGESSDTVALLTTPMRLKGAAERHNIPVPESTMLLLKALDKQLATTGRPVVSRNALITAAAQRVITDPEAYASARGRDPQSAFFAIQGRVPTGLPVELRAAAYSVEPPLVVAHAMAAAVEQLLEELQAQVKKAKTSRK